MARHWSLGTRIRVWARETVAASRRQRCRGSRRRRRQRRRASWPALGGEAGGSERPGSGGRRRSAAAAAAAERGRAWRAWRHAARITRRPRARANRKRTSFCACARGCSKIYSQAQEMWAARGGGAGHTTSSRESLGIVVDPSEAFGGGNFGAASRRAAVGRPLWHVRVDDGRALEGWSGRGGAGERSDGSGGDPCTAGGLQRLQGRSASD